MLSLAEIASSEITSLHAEIALKRVKGKHGILPEEKLGVLFQ